MKRYDEESGNDKIPVPNVAHNIFSQRVHPSFVVDVSDFLEAKMDAIRAHSSQFYDANSSEPETRLTSKSFLDELEARSRYFGSLIGVEAGEPYYVREVLNIDDPVELLTRPMNLYS
jgi:LmbE family N-acetylglucosaminyl deacetylase